jgi:PAS domain S-box-containing protein
VSEDQSSEQALRYLASATALLGESLDVEQTLQAVVRAAVPVLADWCALELKTPEGPSRLVAVAHPDPEKMKLAWELREKWPEPPDATTGVQSVLRSGKPEMVPLIPPELLDRSAQSPEHLSVLRTLGLRGYIVVPLQARGRILGALTLISAESGRVFGSRDLDVAQSLAGRAAVALDNVRLYADLRRANHELKAAQQLFQALVDNLPELAWSALPDGHVDFYNRRWFEYTGTTFAQMQGWGWKTVHEPRMLAQVVERWTHSLKTGEPFEMEFPLRRADGQMCWFLTRVKPLRDADGRIVRWFGTNIDIHERREARLRTEALLAEVSEQVREMQAALLEMRAAKDAAEERARSLSRSPR